MLFNYLFKRPKVLPATSSEDLVVHLLVMAWMGEARDPYTSGHLWRISRFARLLAQSLGLKDEDVARISIGALLHDLGKIAIPDSILKKPSQLTEEEYEVIKTSPEVGTRMLEGHPLNPLVKDTILSHHETPDQKGYPNQSSWDDVSLDAKIIGICVAFDAMTRARSYRSGMPISKALQIIDENLGTQFDRTIGLHFLQLGKLVAFNHIVGHTDEDIPLHHCPQCGPTLVQRKSDEEGAHIYCRNCSSEFVLEATANGLRPKATGKKGTARDLEAEADTELIQRLVNESAKHIELSVTPAY
ncbi:MAG TPA: HD domain-containing phosphohydrolase [Methylophilaceae bacterium]|nr:HD domain-containing phosphohydrolase [Methylophilaceae bacterium]